MSLGRLLLFVNLIEELNLEVRPDSPHWEHGSHTNGDVSLMIHLIACELVEPTAQPHTTRSRPVDVEAGGGRGNLIDWTGRDEEMDAPPRSLGLMPRGCFTVVVHGAVRH